MIKNTVMFIFTFLSLIYIVSPAYGLNSTESESVPTLDNIKNNIVLKSPDEKNLWNFKIDSDQPQYINIELPENDFDYMLKEEGTSPEPTERVWIIPKQEETLSFQEGDLYIFVIDSTTGQKKSERVRLNINDNMRRLLAVVYIHDKNDKYKPIRSIWINEEYLEVDSEMTEEVKKQLEHAKASIPGPNEQPNTAAGSTSNINNINNTPTDSISNGANILHDAIPWNELDESKSKENITLTINLAKKDNTWEIKHAEEYQAGKEFEVIFWVLVAVLALALFLNLLQFVVRFFK